MWQIKTIACRRMRGEDRRSLSEEGKRRKMKTNKREKKQRTLVKEEGSVSHNRGRDEKQTAWQRERIERAGGKQRREDEEEEERRM